MVTTSSSRRRVATLALVVGLLVVGLLAAPAIALAGDGPELSEGGKLPVVQNRQYRLEHEISAGIGVLPIDAFYKGMSFNLGYNWHWTDTLAFGAGFSYLLNFNTSLRDNLEQNFTVSDNRFAELLYFGEVGVLFKPVYGKLALLNKTPVYGELYFSLDAVVGNMQGGEKTLGQPLMTYQHIAFGAAPGFGLRGFINERLSVRFDLRYLLLYSDGEGHFPLSLSLSLSFTTRRDP